MIDRPANPARVALAVIALAVGFAVWLWLNLRVIGPRWGFAVPVLIAFIAMAPLLVPRVRNWATGHLDQLRTPDPKTRATAALAVTVAAGLYLAFTAYVHGRPLFPRVHDELSYLLGAQMLGRGRLWMPPHPLADFFDSFHILVRPVYASIYFPGTAAMHVPAVWLGLPTWVTPVAIAAGIVGLTYRVVSELLDGVAGLLSAMILVGNSSFRVFSTNVMAQLPAALLGLAMIWAWLRWRHSRRVGWAAAAGAFAGWAAITRPVDAIAFAIPVALAIAWDLRRATPKAWATTIGAGVLATTPFLLVQAAFNVGVTGSVLRTPYVMYLEQNQPGTAYASSAAPSSSATAPALLPQKRIYLESLLAQETEFRGKGAVQWLLGRVAMTLWSAVPSATLLIVAPAAVMLLPHGRSLWVLCVVPVLFVAMYLLNPLYLSHYPLVLAPCVACWIVAGAAALSGRAANGPNAWLTFGIAGVCIGALPEVNPALHDAYDPVPILDSVEKELATIDGPAVVLFRFHPESNVHEEPVYNSAVAWPDDARVIRAHDLGPARDVELFSYYGSREPARTFYLFDRGDGSLTRLGSADEAAARLAERAAPRP